MAVFEAVHWITEAKEQTVVMVEDKVDELVEHADRLVLIGDGEILLDGTPEEFCRRKDLLDSVEVRPPQVAAQSRMTSFTGPRYDRRYTNSIMV